MKYIVFYGVTVRVFDDLDSAKDFVSGLLGATIYEAKEVYNGNIE